MLSLEAKKRAAISLVELSTEAIRIKSKRINLKYQRSLAEQVYKKQAGRFEGQFVKAIEPLFQRQISSALEKLSKLSTLPTTSKSIFDPKEWDDELVNRSLPPIAKAMAESAMAQYVQIQNQIRSMKGFDNLKCGGRGGKPGPCPSNKPVGKPSQSAAQKPNSPSSIKPKTPLARLSKTERNALEDYSTDKFQKINGELRSGKVSKDSQRTIKAMDSGLAKAEKRPGATIRSFDLPHGAEGDKIRTMLKAGGELSDAGYTSTRKVPSLSDRAGFVDKKAQPNRVILKVVGKNGVDISEVSKNKVEGEVLYPRGTKFKVVQSEHLSNGAILAVVEEIHHTKSTKASTASNWIMRLGPSHPKPIDDVVFSTPYGKVSMQFLTEYPEWMKKDITSRLSETFAESYWPEINETTGGDIDGLLQNGLLDGWSVEQMAKEMRDRYGSDEYPKSRGRLIARTESGNALNAARSDVIDRLKEELGDKYPMRKTWLSVLGNTTRNTHANLDSVPAADDGCWALGGIRCRWPGDVRLPARERCNCQCSLFTSFGLQDAAAEELIAEHEVREMAEGKSVLTCWGVKCGGPGSGIPGPCPFPWAHADDDSIIPGKVGNLLGIDTSNFQSQKTLMELHTIENLYMKGDHVAIKNANPSTFHGQLAKENLIKKIDAMQASLPAGAKASIADPAVATPAGWKKIGDQLGTEKGGTYELNGQKFYVKQPDDPARAHNEVLALNLYSVAGAGAVKGTLVNIDGKTSVATEWIDKSEKVNWNLPANKVLAASDFAVHAWLNNRDAIGAGSEKPEDNIRLDKSTGKLSLVDAGGSLDYKGMGGSGKKPFTKDVPEWDTFRDPSVNPTMAKVFGSMTPQQLVDSTKKLKNVSDQHIEELVHKFGNEPKDKMIETLKARRDAILEIGKKLEDQIAVSQVPYSAPAKPVQTTTAIPPSVPPPPNIVGTGKTGKNLLWYQNMQGKFDAVYEAAKAGDLNALHAIKANPDSTDSWTKKVAAYKAQAIAAVEAGGKPDTSHVVPTPPKPVSAPQPVQATTSKPVPAFGAPTPPVKATPKIDPDLFPSNPVFKSTNLANVQANNAKVQEALDLAKAGDLVGLNGMLLPPSPTLKAWHADLAANLSVQMNPPQKPVSIHHDYSTAADGIKSAAQFQSGKAKVGYWVVLGEVSNVPSGIQPGTWQPNGSTSLWDAGQSAYEKSKGAKDALKKYTSSSYKPMNSALRTNDTGHSSYNEAIKASQAIMDHGHPIQPGLMLSRKHGGVSTTDWSSVKPGTVISDKGILSTSVDQGVWSGTTEFKMTVGPGVKGMAVKNFSLNSGEDEVLLPPNQRIMVTHTEIKNSTTIVHAIVLPTQSDQCCPP